jgi:dipeptidyl aminopeptidase/acylaminoacyl peptidase
MKHELFFCDPAVDTPVMPCDEPLIMDSHGSRIFGRLLRPAFYDDTSAAPIVMMMHGHPGGDRNLDIAAYLRANGYAVAYFSYRGIWGSQGDYCLSHNIEDVISVAAYLRENAAQYRIDPDRFYLFGHSMGGFSALNAMAAGLKVSGAILMAPCDTGYMYLHQPERFGPVLMNCKKSGYFRLPCEDYMEQDAAIHAKDWYFPNLATRLDASIPYRFIGGARDITTPPQQHILPLLNRLQELGADARYTEFDDGHAFPISRVRLARTTLGWLSEIEAGQNKKSGY